MADVIVGLFPVGASGLISRSTTEATRLYTIYCLESSCLIYWPRPKQHKNFRDDSRWSLFPAVPTILLERMRTTRSTRKTRVFYKACKEESSFRFQKADDHKSRSHLSRISGYRAVDDRVDRLHRIWLHTRRLIFYFPSSVLEKKKNKTEEQEEEGKKDAVG